MIKNIVRVCMGSLIGMLLFAAAAPAQDSWMGDVRDKYLISAKAGGVNFVEGMVTVVANDGSQGRLTKGDRLEAGDVVTTGANGKAEILLNPGSYARLGSNSTFEFKSTSLDELEINLSRGSAIFEVFASKDFEVTLTTPRSKMALIQSGIYRLDVLADGSGKLIINKGRAQLYDNTATVVKGDREVTVNGSTSQVAKFDGDDKDSLDIWSKERAKELARISRKADVKNMRTALMSSFYGRQWNMYNSFGLWAYDPFWGSYSFLPFGWGWNSPYGYGFGPCIGAYNLPPVVYMPPHNTNPTTGGGGGGNPNTPIAQNPRGGVHPPFASSAPPFVRIQNDPKSGSSITDNGGGFIRPPTRDISNDSSSPSFPSSSPASSSPIDTGSTVRGASKKG
jgi:hypothetical protein